MENIFLEIPKVCPYCGYPTEIKKDNDSEVLYCTNEQCESRLVNRLDHFCGKKGLDINGLSKATLGKFIEWGWVESIEDLYNIGTRFKQDFILKPGFGIKSVTKILNAIEDSKHTTLDAFISAIGIPLIGKAVAKDLTNYFETYEDFRNAVNDKNYHFYDLDNFGEEMDRSLKNFNYAEADRISKLLFIEAPVVNNNQTNNNLSGKTIVITGKLTNFKNRAELKSVIESHGGKVVDSISAKTDILINNDINSTSSKNNAAKKRGIPIISELDFIKQYIEN
jgi:DNA ligase (NAD+)